jgi:hypothetical protein
MTIIYSVIFFFFAVAKASMPPCAHAAAPTVKAGTADIKPSDQQVQKETKKKFRVNKPVVNNQHRYSFLGPQDWQEAFDDSVTVVWEKQAPVGTSVFRRFCVVLFDIQEIGASIDDPRLGIELDEVADQIGFAIKAETKNYDTSDAAKFAVWTYHEAVDTGLFADKTLSLRIGIKQFKQAKTLCGLVIYLGIKDEK